MIAIYLLLVLFYIVFGIIGRIREDLSHTEPEPELESKPRRLKIDADGNYTHGP